ncbi:protein CFAP20DC [Takifugu rubripes]|uniref:protein CFAP20DC n=1 Tax=Takifugu rubripes TaxID=31033 RepID=UPI001145DAA2|nr:uncharacterized protein C3orf67 homolog [Takifugu rubripes]
MFKNKYQGGSVFELFSGRGNNPVAHWKLCGGSAAIRREYNKEVNGWVYCLEGSSHLVKMQLPENPKQSLGLSQRLLVLQVNVPQGKGFSIEITISDKEKQKKRLHFSTVYKGLSVNLFHAKIPLTGLQNNWSVLLIDLESLAGELFKGISTLDAISLYASCQIRRIFTMKSAASADGETMVSLIPCSYQLPPNVIATTCVLNMKNLQCAKISHHKTPKAAAASTAKPRQPAKDLRGRPTKESLVRSTVSINLWENKSEVQLRLCEKAVMPQTDQMKREQSQKERKNMATGDDPVETDRRRAYEAILEEDLIGSDNDEDSMYFTFQLPRAASESTVASPGGPYSALDMELKDPSGFQDLYPQPLQALSPPLQVPRATVTSPTRCLSPVLAFPKRENRSGSERPRGVSNVVCADSSGLFSHSLLQEVKPDDAQHKAMNSGEGDYKSGGSSSSDYLKIMNLPEEDKEALQMLASLRREQEEDDCGASSLGGPVVRQWDINTSFEESLWNPSSTPNSNVDYDEEINTLQLMSREWMDALRPPATSPSQQRRSGTTRTSQENLIRAYRSMMEKKDSEEEDKEEDEELDEEQEEEEEDEFEEEEEDEELEGEEDLQS